MDYNLIQERWIPVLYRDGQYRRVGIRKAIADAHRIRQIAASNPMDNIALLRFLLVVMQWCKPEGLGQLDGTKGIPDDWMTERLGPAEEPNQAFNLLGDGERFYQDHDVDQNDRPIGDLLVEFPTETKIAHFRHVRDKQYGLCPACCALGIIRFGTFANAYAGGKYTSAINGPAPAYALKVRSSLLESLGANWPGDPITADDSPSWLRHTAPGRKALKSLHVLSWRSRRTWLGECGEGQDTCAYCGQSARLVRTLAFSGGWRSPFIKGEMQDRHVLWEEPKAGEKKTLTFPTPGSGLANHARFWHSALQAMADAGNVPSEEPREDSAGVIYVAGPAANKGLYQDASSFHIRPLTSHDAPWLAAMSELRKGLSAVLCTDRRRLKRKCPDRKAALDAISCLLESNLIEQWNRGVRDVAGPADTIREIVEYVVRATTAGSVLDRREALLAAQSRMDAQLEKAAKPPATPLVELQSPKNGRKRTSRKR